MTVTGAWLKLEGMRRKLPTLITAVLLCALPALAETRLRLEPAFPKLEFERPVAMEEPRDGSKRLFVVEQRGTIRVFRRDVSEKSEIFLDIRDRVEYDQSEMGLLGLAFHPKFAENGFFYVNYTAGSPMRTVIARFRVDPKNPALADRASAKTILEIAQPYSNHNGGQVSFGPDGYLYVGMGDGGAAGDPHGHGQNRKTLLGDLLRIDVDRPTGGRAYGIPPDNPFVGNRDGWREEIYAWGLRNPWRFGWDAQGRLWLADVGQNRREEIDLVEKGKNYGWNVMEGSLCFKPREGCDKTGLEPPVAEYGRDEGGCVTGGYVYAGRRAPSLAGAYVYGDFLSTRIWTYRAAAPGGARNDLLFESGKQIASFALDADGELYVLAFDGRIYGFTEGP